MKVSPLKSFPPKGVTLVELMVVVGIMVVLAGLGLSTFSYVQNKQKREKTNIQISQMEAAIASYRLENQSIQPGDGGGSSSVEIYRMVAGDGDLNGTLDEGLQVYLPALANAEDSQNGFKLNSSFEILDAYNTPYRYQFPGQRNPPTEPDIWSAGPDRRFGTDDDITNW